VQIAETNLEPQESRRLLWGLTRGDLEVLSVAICIKALLFLFGMQSYQVLQDERVSGLHGALEIWNRWDSINYQKLAQFGYSANGDLKPLLVFYPLFPWAVRAVAFVARDYLFSAFIVSTVASLITPVIFRRLVSLDYPKALAQRAVWFLLIFPTSYFLHIGYTEGLFLMLVVSCVYATRKRRWLIASILGGLACLTRANGLMLGPVMFFEALNDYTETKRWRRQWLWIVIVGIGFGGYLVLNKVVAGNFFAFASLEQQFFGKSLATPFTGIDNAIGSLSRAPSDAEMVGMQEVVFIVLGLLCTVVSWIKLRRSYAVWMTGNWLLFVSVSFVLSVPRYTLAMFPIFILFAMLSRRRLWFYIISVWCLIYLGLFASTFVRGHWAF